MSAPKMRLENMMMSTVLVVVAITLLCSPVDGFLKIGRKREAAAINIEDGEILEREIMKDIYKELWKIQSGVNKVQQILKDVNTLRGVEKIMDLKKESNESKESSTNLRQA